MIARREEPPYPPVHCCKECRHFRRHDDGRGLCMVPMPSHADTAEQHRALAGTNARNFCRHYRLLHTEESNGDELRILQGADAHAA